MVAIKVHKPVKTRRTMFSAEPEPEPGAGLSIGDSGSDVGIKSSKLMADHGKIWCLLMTSRVQAEY